MDKSMFIKVTNATHPKTHTWVNIYHVSVVVRTPQAYQLTVGGGSHTAYEVAFGTPEAKLIVGLIYMNEL